MAPIPTHCATLRSELDSLTDLSTLVGRFLSDEKRKNSSICCYDDKNFMLFGLIPMQRHHCRCCQHSICDNHTRYVKFIPKDDNQTNKNYTSYKILDDKSDPLSVKLCTECVNILNEFSKKNDKDSNKLNNDDSSASQITVTETAEKNEVVDTPVTESVTASAPVAEEPEKNEAVDTTVTESVTTAAPVTAEPEKNEVLDTPVTESVTTTAPVTEEPEKNEEASDTTTSRIVEVADPKVSVDTGNSEGAKKKRNKNKNKKN